MDAVSKYCRDGIIVLSDMSITSFKFFGCILEHIDTYIVPPGLGNNSGAIGSLLLAVRALG